MRLLGIACILHELVVISHGLEETVAEQSIDVGDQNSLAILEVADLVFPRLGGVSFRLSV